MNTIFNVCTKSVNDLLKDIATSLEHGLSTTEVGKRQAIYGFNELANQKKWYQKKWLSLFLRQWKSPFIYLLMVAAVLAWFTGDGIEAAMIVCIMTINSFLGFYQEYKASLTLNLLKKYLTFHEKVIRDAHLVLIPVRELVPGDIIILEPGDIVPADIRLVQVQGLQVNESLLSGESVPVAKISGELSTVPQQIFQAQNICFAGTTVVEGKGTAVVVAIGEATVLADVTRLSVQTERESSFAKGITDISRFIIRMVIVTLCTILLANALIKGTSSFNAQLLIFILALAVTIVPQVLPTVITFSLSQGAMQLARNKVVVKRLTAIEDLGSVEILCTDKTGTLTENNLTVADVYAHNKEEAIFYAALMATPFRDKKISTSSFDQALQTYALQTVKMSQADYEQVAQVPFEPERRRSSALFKKGNDYILVVRGAYEEIIKKVKALDNQETDTIIRWIAHQGEQGNRVLAVAKKNLGSVPPPDLKQAEQGLDFLGVIAFVDPIKKSSFSAVNQAQQLGVQIKMLTGDSPEVAGYVGLHLGLISHIQEVMTGEFFEKLSDEEKRKAALSFVVFARVSPQQKFEIVQLLQKKYEVGFLGDGINDAPALHIAQVAIAVQGSADIAVEAADIVLLKKSLAVIIEGIKEGRKTFANTVKYIKTTMASGVGNFYAVAIASLLIDYLPMLPLQILLVNLLTDFPMLAISTDAVDIAELRDPKNYNIKGIALISIIFGLLSTIFDLIFFISFYHKPPYVLQTNWFIGSVLTEFCLVLSMRTRNFCFKAIRPSTALLILMFIMSIITLALPFSSWGHAFFGFVAPTWAQLRLTLCIVAAYFAVTEYVKLIYYRMVRE